MHESHPIAPVSTFIITHTVITYVPKVPSLLLRGVLNLWVGRVPLDQVRSVTEAPGISVTIVPCLFLQVLSWLSLPDGGILIPESTHFHTVRHFASGGLQLFQQLYDFLVSLRPTYNQSTHNVWRIIICQDQNELPHRNFWVKIAQAQAVTTITSRPVCRKWSRFWLFAG